MYAPGVSESLQKSLSVEHLWTVEENSEKKKSSEYSKLEVKQISPPLNNIGLHGHISAKVRK